MAGYITVNGQARYSPGVINNVNASELATLSPASTGIVAVIGEFPRGGEPKKVVEIENLYGLRNLGLDDADLNRLTNLAFRPGKDSSVPGGIAKMLFMRANPAVQGQLQFTDGLTKNTMLMKSQDYGLYANQFRSRIVTPGTNFGCKVEVEFEGTVVETHDPTETSYPVLRLKYTGTEMDEVMGAVQPRSLAAAGANVAIADFPYFPYESAFDGALTFETTGAGTPSIRVVGINKASGLADYEDVAIAGPGVPATSAKTWSEVIYIDVITPGSVSNVKITGYDAGVGMTVGQKKAAILLAAFPYAPNEAAFDGRVAIVTTGAGTPVFTVAGTNKSTGLSDTEDVTISGPNAPSCTLKEWSAVTSISVKSGTFTNADVYAKAFNLSADTYDTIAKVSNRINAFQTQKFFAWTLIGNTAFNVVDMDVDQHDMNGANLDLNADLWYLLQYINAASSYVEVTRSTYGDQLPTTPSALTYFTGGLDGTVSASDHEDCLTELENWYCNSIVMLTGEASHHAKGLAHVVAMSATMPRMLFTGPKLYTGYGNGSDELWLRSTTLANRNIVFCPQGVEIWNSSGSDTEILAPYWTALLTAAVDAGKSDEWGVTRRPVNIQGIVDCPDASKLNGTAWSVQANKETLLAHALCLYEWKDGVGYRVLRGITTHQSDDNPIYSSIVGNMSLNVSVYDMKEYLELLIGRINFSGTAAIVKGKVRERLQMQQNLGMIKAFDQSSIEVTDNGDSFDVGYKAAYLEEITWINHNVYVSRILDAV